MEQRSDPGLVLEGIRRAGIDLVASLPDINLLSKEPGLIHVPLSREEEGIGIAAWAYLGGKIPEVLMQDGGLLIACNALTTTALQFERQMVLLVRRFRGSERSA